MEYRGCGMRAERKNRLDAKETTSVEKFSSHCIKFIILRLSYDLKPHFIPLLTRTQEPRAQTHLTTPCAFYTPTSKHLYESLHHTIRVYL